MQMVRRLPRDRLSSRQARVVIDEVLGDSVPIEAVEDAKLVVSELVSNALMHGVGEIELRIDITEDRLRIEVTDEGQGAHIAQRAIDVGGGHGLRLVESLSIAWGTAATRSCVWADLALAG